MAYFKCSGLNPTGNAAEGDVLSGKTFSNDSGIDKTGTMPNRGAVSATLNASTTSYTVPAGYHNGSGTVSISTQSKSASSSTSAQTISPDSGKVLSSVSIAAISPQRSAGTAATYSGIDSTGPFVYFPYGWWPNAHSTYGCYTRLTAAQAVAACPSQTKTITSSRSAQTVTPDSGKLLSSVTVNGLAPTGTYTASSRGASLDMGATSNYRYVNTNSVPNTNSGTYTFASGDTGGTKDLGAANTYRYVNAANVYAKGKADGGSNPPINSKVYMAYGMFCDYFPGGDQNANFLVDKLFPTATQLQAKSVEYDFVVSYSGRIYGSGTAVGTLYFDSYGMYSSTALDAKQLFTISTTGQFSGTVHITGSFSLGSSDTSGRSTYGSAWGTGDYAYKTQWGISFRLLLSGANGYAERPGIYANKLIITFY